VPRPLPAPRYRGCEGAPSFRAFGLCERVGLISADLTSPFFFSFFSVISVSGVVIVDHDSCGTTGAADIFAAHPLFRAQKSKPRSPQRACPEQGRGNGAPSVSIGTEKEKQQERPGHPPSPGSITVRKDGGKEQKCAIFALSTISSQLA